MELKDSGISWIGKIPKNWSVSKIKHYCTAVFAGGTPDTGRPEYWDGNISWLPSGSIQNNIINEPVRYITQLGLEKSSTKMISANTALVAMTGATCSNVGFLTFDSCANQSVTAFIPKQTSLSKYIFYALLSSKEQILLKKTGGAQGGVNVEDCKNIFVPYITLLEQKAIADYLDKECAQIDDIVEKQRNIIEKLKEYKKSVITEAVTKGLNPAAKMKDSGIEWMGKIPEHWEVKKIKYIFQLREEKNYMPLEQVNLISLYTEKGVLQHSDIEETTGNKAQNADGYKIVHKGDIIVNIILCWMGAIGVSAYDGVTSPAYDIYRPLSNTNSKYYHHLFRTSLFSGECYKVGRGIMMMRWRTYSEQFKSIYVQVPPLTEQQAIADYLNQKCTEIDSVIEKREKMIDLLTEYKKSLIYECVTGKKEVA